MAKNATILEAAVNAVVESYKADMAGDSRRAPVHTRMHKAVEAARAVGYSSADIFGTADRRYGRYLIDNAT